MSACVDCNKPTEIPFTLATHNDECWGPVKNRTEEENDGQAECEL